MYSGRFGGNSSIMIYPRYKAPRRERYCRGRNRYRFTSGRNTSFSFRGRRRRRTRRRTRRSTGSNMILYGHYKTRGPGRVFCYYDYNTPLCNSSGGGPGFRRGRGGNRPGPGFGRGRNVPPFNIPFNRTGPRVTTTFSPVTKVGDSRPLISSVATNRTTGFVNGGAPCCLEVFGFVGGFGGDEFGFSTFVLSKVCFLCQGVCTLKVLFSILAFNSAVTSNCVGALPT